VLVAQAVPPEAQLQARLGSKRFRVLLKLRFNRLPMFKSGSAS